MGLPSGWQVGGDFALGPVERGDFRRDENSHLLHLSLLESARADAKPEEEQQQQQQQWPPARIISTPNSRVHSGPDHFPSGEIL